MKAFKIILGALAGIYSIAQLIQVIYLFINSTGSEHHFLKILGAVSWLCISAVISILLFKSAFKISCEEADDDEYDIDEDFEDEEEYEYEDRGELFQQALVWRAFFECVFWVNLVGLNIGLMLLVKLAESRVLIGNPVTIARIFVFFAPPAFFVLYPWQIVGLWRCCNRHKIETGNSRTGRVVQGLIIMGIIGSVAQLSVLVPVYKDYLSIGFRKDPFDNCRLEVKKDNTIIHLQGTLGFGISKKVGKLLKEYPGIEGIILDSGGGRIYEGRQIGKLISKYGLDTYSLTQCCSAASIAFISGQRRFLAVGATMGYHQYKMDYSGLEPFTDLGKEQTADLGLFRRQGVKEDFLDKLFNASHDDLWFPSHEEMLAAGVIDEVIKPKDLLGDEYKLNIEEFEQGLLAVNFYKVVKKYDPETYDEILKAFTKQIDNGATLSEIQLAGAAIIETMAVKLMPVTSDEALTGYIRTFIKVLKKASDADPELGMRLIFPQIYGAPDMSGHFTLKEQMILPESLEKVVLDAYEKENPAPDIEAGQLQLIPIQVKIKDVARYLDPNNLKGKEDYKKCCEAMIKFYELILAEEDKTAANILRCVFSQVQ